MPQPPEPQPQPAYYTPRQLAATLALHRSTICGGCRRGMWNAVKLFGEWRVPRRRLDAWLAAQHANALVPREELVDA